MFLKHGWRQCRIKLTLRRVLAKLAASDLEHLLLLSSPIEFGNDVLTRDVLVKHVQSHLFLFLLTLLSLHHAGMSYRRQICHLTS